MLSNLLCKTRESLRVFFLVVTPAALFLAGISCAQAQTTAATINGSVTITTGNTFQQILAAVGNPPATRRSLTIQNNNATDSCWISFGTIAGVPITAANAAKGTSILLTAGGSYQRYFPYVPSDAIIGTCATNSDTLYVDTQ